MIRKIVMSLLCASGLWASNAIATTEHVFSQGMAIEYELPVNDPQVFSNIFFWTIKANCMLTSEAPENIISVKMLKKSGTVNTRELVSGDSVELLVQTGETIFIAAESGAKVELNNLGTKKVMASCSSAY